MDAKDLLGELHSRVEALVSGEDWQQMLTIANNQHNYSFNNMMLIAWQRPGATKVNGFKKWQTFGRMVRKGERSIKILAPIIVKQKQDDGTYESKCVGFKVVSVFDISQTDGDPLPVAPEAKLLEGEGPAGALATIVKLIEREGFSFKLGQPGGGANGVTIYSDKQVIVRDDVDEAQQVKTALHELGHVLMHGPKVAGTITRAQAEVEAESVAFVVAGKLGLDTTPYSFGYVTSWSGGDVKLVQKTGQRVLKTAERVIKTLLAA